MMTKEIAVFMVTAAGTAHADRPALDETARAIVTAQLAASMSPDAILATLTPDAIIMGNGSIAVASDSNAAAAVLGTLGRAPGVQTYLSRLEAGGTSDVMWFAADVALVGGYDEVCGTDVQLLEVATVERGSWRVVALSFVSSSNATTTGDRLGPPRAGVLAQVMESPYKLYGALRDDRSTMVLLGNLGNRARLALGRDDARRAFEFLRDRSAKLDGAVEVRRDRWGFAVGEVVISADPHAGTSTSARAQLLLVGVRDGARWDIAALHVILPEDPRTLTEPSPPCRMPPVRSTSLREHSIEP